MTDIRIIRVRNRKELDALPRRDANRAHVIICAGKVTKARSGYGHKLGETA